MTELNLLSMTQRKALLAAVATANEQASLTQVVRGNACQLSSKASANNQKAINMVNVVKTPTEAVNTTFGSSISMINYGNTSDLVTIGGKTCGIAGSGIISDTYINEVSDKTLGSIKTMSGTSASITYKGKSPADLHNIKVVIYNLYHKDDNKDVQPEEPVTPPEDPEEPVTPPEDPEEPVTPPDEPDEPETPPADDGYKSFISTCNGTGATFDTVDEMFSVLSQYGIDTSKGISRADLVKLTQDDTWEDSHWDFFGCLNRIFDALDTDGKADNYLTKEELKIFFSDGKIDEDYSDYLTRVLEYSQQINETYQNMTDAQKVQYCLDKTREYLEAMGMQAQIDALDRLLSQQDYRTLTGTETSDDIINGNIVFSDLGGAKDGYITLGAYSYFTYLLGGSATYTVDGKTYDVNLYGVDHSESADECNSIDGSTWEYGGESGVNDVGITLNSNAEADMLNKPWYFIVDTLVHELTHATAYQYVSESNPNGRFSTFNYDEIEKFYNDGLLTNTEWGQFNGARDVNIFKYDDSLDDWVVDNPGLYSLYTKLMYLTACKWGEYAAYQADADFVDSIGGDVLNTLSDKTHCDTYTSYNGDDYYLSLTTSANGTNEKTIITNHIVDGYGEQEPLPSYKWWTDGDNGILA